MSHPARRLTLVHPADQTNVASRLRRVSRDRISLGAVTGDDDRPIQRRTRR